MATEAVASETLSQPASVAPGTGPASTVWRGIDELAQLVGAYCWVENRIFELSGAWASGPDAGRAEGLPAALRIWCAGVSRRHGLLAGRWFERLPVRAGVEPADLVTAPPGPLAGALEALGTEAEARTGVTALILSVLPRLQAVYTAHRRTAPPVSEAPVLEVLAGAQRDLAGEIGGGRSLLETLPDEGPSGDDRFGPALERSFDETDVFPAVSAS